MHQFTELFPRDLYHSYIIEADPDTTAPSLLGYLKERGDVFGLNPDLLYQTYDSFTVLDSELIKEWHNKKGIEDEKRVCIIGTKFINSEAEKSLLKMLEEPAFNTHFFIIVPNSSVLLDTIRSRAHIVKITTPLEDESAKKFFSSSIEERIELVSEIIKNNKDNEGSGGLRADAIKLINGLERIIYPNLKKSKNSKEVEFILEEFQSARDYLGTPGASVKMILEHIALVI